MHAKGDEWWNPSTFIEISKLGPALSRTRPDQANESSPPVDVPEEAAESRNRSWIFWIGGLGFGWPHIVDLGRACCKKKAVLLNNLCRLEDRPHKNSIREP